MTQMNIQRAEQWPYSQCTETTITQRKLMEEPKGVLHCLFSVTVLKEEHATHCGEPDCSGIIDQLPGVIPRYRKGKANTSRGTLNLYLRQAADGRAQSSPFPQATVLNTGRDSSC